MSKLYNSLNRKPIFEFAKRIAVANNEISGIPFDLLNNSTKSIYYYVDLIQYLVDTKLLIGDRVLALPDYLSSKGRFFLEILLWERSLGRST